MFPKGKAPSVDVHAKDKLVLYVYEYLVHAGAPKAARQFLSEIKWERNVPIGDPPGFLQAWWCVFWDLYSAAPERRDSFEHSGEAKAFHDYGFVNPGYANGSPHGVPGQQPSMGPGAPVHVKPDQMVPAPGRVGGAYYHQPQPQYVTRFPGGAGPRQPVPMRLSEYSISGGLQNHGAPIPMHGMEMQPGGHPIVGIVPQPPQMQQMHPYPIRGPHPVQNGGMAGPGSAHPVHSHPITGPHSMGPAHSVHSHPITGPHSMGQGIPSGMTPMTPTAGGPLNHWRVSSNVAMGQQSCSTPLLNSPHDSTASSDMFMVARNSQQQQFHTPTDPLQGAMVASDLVPSAGGVIGSSVTMGTTAMTLSGSGHLSSGVSAMIGGEAGVLTSCAMEGVKDGGGGGMDSGGLESLDGGMRQGVQAEGGDIQQQFNLGQQQLEQHLHQQQSLVTGSVGGEAVAIQKIKESMVADAKRFGTPPRDSHETSPSNEGAPHQQQLTNDRAPHHRQLTNEGGSKLQLQTTQAGGPTSSSSSSSATAAPPISESVPPKARKRRKPTGT